MPERQFLEALKLFRELDLAWVAAYTGLDAVVADVLEPAERQRVADEARTTFERLGAQPYIARAGRSPGRHTGQSRGRTGSISAWPPTRCVPPEGAYASIRDITR